ncbi:MAG: peptide chain release factor N(5)-glutamine methyltransferase [Bacteroidota bacterium]
MQLLAARQALISHLTPKYGQAEAQSLARIVFEDVFFPLGMESLDEAAKNKLQNIQVRLLKDEPLQYILGQADFFGLKLKVNPAVLIPRQETEELVALILAQVGKKFSGEILDIGTGSGCIPIALKRHLPFATIHACDISGPALQVARENAANHQLEVSFFKLDILQPDSWKYCDTYDIIVSNPPYIPHRESNLMPNSVKAFEPALALFTTDEDPLIFYRQIATFAQSYLNRNGYLFFELNEYHAEASADLLKTQGFEDVQLHLDLNGKARMLSARFF